MAFTKQDLAKIDQLRRELETADAIVIGGGAGLSASAGYDYGGPVFWEHFMDFYEKYGFRDMYSGGFAAYDSLEDKWGFWCRMIWLTRYVDEEKPVYHNLYELVQGKNYFIITTNGDHCFQKAGFDKNRLFYTQGDMGLIQCSRPCHQATYDNEDMVRSMLKSQGYEITEGGRLTVPGGGRPRRQIDSSLIPHCPKCGSPMEVNLRGDDRFVEDAGWHAACRRYETFLNQNRHGHALYLALGVGYNTPGIIKFPFWRMTKQNPNAVYAGINLEQSACPRELAGQSICLDEDIGEVLTQLLHPAPDPS